MSKCKYKEPTDNSVRILATEIHGTREIYRHSGTVLNGFTKSYINNHIEYFYYY